MEVRPKMSRSAARMVWQSGSCVHVYVRDFDPIVIDEPKYIGATDLGPRPTEYLLAAYLGCTSVIAHMVAKEMGFEYSALEGEAAGELDPRGVAGVEGVKPDFEWVESTIRITTAESESRVRALQEAVARRCPLRNTIAKAGARVSERWQIIRVSDTEQVRAR